MKYHLLLLLLLIPVTIAFGVSGDENGIPPTNSLSMINTTSGNVTASSYNSVFTFVGQSGISIITDFFTNTITFALGSPPGGDCSTVGKWLDSFNYTTENFDCDLFPVNNGSSGEINTASNLNPGEGIFNSKVGVDLQFKSLLEGNRIDLTSNSSNITISTTAENNTASNLGNDGLGVFAQKVSEDLQFKKLIAGDGIFLDSNSTSIIINSTSTGEIFENNTASSIGLGNSIVSGKVGVDLQFKGIDCVGSVSCTNNATDVLVTGIDTGEVNTASNLNPGEGIFNSKVGLDLQFKSLLAGSGIILSSNSSNIIINSTGGSGEVNTASNVGTSGSGVFKQKTGVDLEFKKLIGDGSTTVTDNSTNVIISSTDTGEVNTASNLNPGEGIFNSKVGLDLQFKSLLAGSGIILSSNASNITINSTSTGEIFENNTASNVGVNGEGVFNQKTGVDLEFKKLVGAGLAVITSNSSNVIINVTSSGSADNLGNHIATQNLDMNDFAIIDADYYETNATDTADTGEIRLGNAEIIGFESSPAGTDGTITFNSAEEFEITTATDEVYSFNSTHFDLGNTNKLAGTMGCVDGNSLVLGGGDWDCSSGGSYIVNSTATSYSNYTKINVNNTSFTTLKTDSTNNQTRGIKIINYTGTHEFQNLMYPPNMIGSFTPVSTATAFQGLLTGTTISGTASFVFIGNPYYLNVVNFTSGTGAGNNGGLGLFGADQGYYEAQKNPYMYGKFVNNGTGASGNRFVLGFSGSNVLNPNNNDTPCNNSDASFLVVRTTDTLFQWCHNDTSGAGTYTSFGINVDTLPHTFETYTLDGGTSWCAKLDNTELCDTTSLELPSKTFRMYPHFSCETSIAGHACKTGVAYWFTKVQLER